jgi:plasmid stability protein
MATVTVRNLPYETHRALKLRALEHGRSLESEIRDILVTAMQSQERVKIGSALAAFGQRFGGLDIDCPRDPTPAWVVKAVCW